MAKRFNCQTHRLSHDPSGSIPDSGIFLFAEKVMHPPPPPPSPACSGDNRLTIVPFLLFFLVVLQIRFAISVSLGGVDLSILHFHALLLAEACTVGG